MFVFTVISHQNIKDCYMFQSLRYHHQGGRKSNDLL